MEDERMSLRDLILKNRSYRRFHEQQKIRKTVLRDLIDLGRLSASAANRQPLAYMMSCEAKRNAAIFAALSWAGYLKDWDGPAAGERPSAYIVMLCDKEIASSPGCDHGIAAQSIMLGAVEAGLGGCILGAVNRDELRRVLSVPERYDIVLVLALGKPKETVMIDAVKDGDIRYWRDAQARHHVPKRALSDIIVEFD